MTAAMSAGIAGMPSPPRLEHEGDLDDNFARKVYVTPESLRATRVRELEAERAAKHEKLQEVKRRRREAKAR
jgi:hypothetical protein